MHFFLWSMIGLVAGLFFPSTVYSQGESLVSITTSPRDSQSTEVLAVNLSSVISAVSVQLSGLADANEETEKCEALLLLSNGDPITILRDAVSEQKLELIITESRDKARLGKAWLDALSELLTSSSEYQFSIPDGDEFHFPTTTQIRLNLGNISFPRRIINRDKQYLASEFNNFLRVESPDALLEFDDTGIIRVETNSQAAVCFHLLASGYTIDLGVSARTYDRFNEVWTLDQGCIRERLGAMREFFDASPSVDSNSSNEGAAQFLLGVAATEAGTVGKSFLGPGGSKNLCFPRQSNQNIAGIQAALDAWLRISEKWAEFARQSQTFAIDEGLLDDLALGARAIEYLPTKIIYSSEFEVK